MFCDLICSLVVLRSCIYYYVYAMNFLYSPTHKFKKILVFYNTQIYEIIEIYVELYGVKKAVPQKFKTHCLCTQDFAYFMKWFHEI